MYQRLRLVGLLFSVASFLVRCDVPEGPLPPVLRVALDREPSTWNRLLANDLATHVVTDQLHAKLVALDAETQTLEPRLAESWEFVDDALVFHLRKGVVFSDGEPFTARDVLFTFDVLQDPDVPSQLAETVRIDGEPVVCEALDDHTVAFRLPRRTAGFERVFDSIGILPAHRFARSLEAGTLEADTGTGAPPRSIVGLGPFRLRSYEPGQRIVVERNPHYFRSAEGLPKLDAIVFEILAEKSTSLLRLTSGELDVVDLLDPESFRALAEDTPEGVEIVDAGPGLAIERFWFNLNPKGSVPPHKRVWFNDARFRRAISLAVDRETLARVVFRGYASPASGPVSPANVLWKSDGPPLEHDVERARDLLTDSGFTRVAGGALVDAGGRPVTFTLVTRSDETHTRIGGFLQNSFRALGIEMHVAQPGVSLSERVTRSFDYEAALLSIGPTDPDPSSFLPFWMSTAPLHFWHPSQSEPATEWEARVDELMTIQAGALARDERKKAYDEVQRIAREQMPMVELVVPHVLLASRSHVKHLRPTPLAHFLWNSDVIAVREVVGKPTRGDLGDPRH